MLTKIGGDRRVNDLGDLPGVSSWELASLGPCHPLAAWRSHGFRWGLMSGANIFGVDLYREGDRSHFKFMAI